MAADKVPKLKMNNGLKVPILGLGTSPAWQNTDAAVIEQSVKDAIDVGYRHLDSAYLYFSEAPVGKAIKDKIHEGVIQRKDVFVTSKLWCNSMREDMVVSACKKSVETFGLEYLDLYLIHLPIALEENDTIMFLPGPDGKSPPYSEADYVNTWKAMEKCVELGLTKSIGVSNFNSKQLQRILENCQIKPVINQVESHPYLTQEKLLEFCREQDILLTAYSPLGSFGIDRPGGKGKEVLTEEKLKKIAEKYGKTPAQIALRWQVQRKVIVIPKSFNKTRMEENFNVFDFELSKEDMASIESLNRNSRVVGLEWFSDHPHYPFGIKY